MSKEAIENFSEELGSMMDFAHEVADYHDCNTIRASLGKIDKMIKMGLNELLIDMFISKTHSFWTDKNYVDEIIIDIVGTLDNNRDIIGDTPEILIGKLKNSVKTIVPYCLSYVYHKREPVIENNKTKFTVVYCPGLSISKAKKNIS